MSHTPGPWSNERIWDTPASRIHARVNGIPVALAEVFTMHRASEKEANARLIAAAPDMKAVLDELEEAFDRDIYPEQKKEDFDAPDDREYSVTITAKQWRAMTRALNKAESRGAMEAPLQTPERSTS